MADARLRVFQATVGTAALHQRSETSGCIIYSVALVFLHARINLSPFTKDFRGGEQQNESID